MSIRLIGAVIILGVSTFSAVRCLYNNSKRIRGLTSLIISLGILRSEICDCSVQLADAINELKREDYYPSSSVYIKIADRFGELGDKTFAEIWAEEFSKDGPVSLSPDEKAVISELGRALGRYTVYEQQKHFEYCIRTLENKLEKVKNVGKKDSKAAAAVSLAAGVMSVILFI